MKMKSLLQRYFARLPLDDPEAVATLGEGETPLVLSRALGPRLGLRHLYFKLEQTNPTGSYKDRFAAMMVSLMRERGQTTCLATSSGNTGAALCAYAARYRLICRLYINEETPQGKIAQILAYGQ
ncbi:MAG TPA: pyridoxal-phosphate dependent enzyme, partial [Limnochordia bacterium]|nr:pyridoxal-phosphate dependent enzyme [Limnochordia bacterium]